MRKTLVLLTATGALTFGVAVPAAATSIAAPPSTVAVEEAESDGDRTGLWGLLGLLGLAGLAKRKESADTNRH